VKVDRWTPFCNGVSGGEEGATQKTYPRFLRLAYIHTMSFVSAYQPPLKTACLGGVSLHVIQIGYGVLPEFECNELESAEYGDVPSYGTQNNSAWTLLVWLRLWLHWICGGQDAPFTEQSAHGLNRHRRRMEHREIPPARNLMPYYKFCATGLDGRKLSPTQFMERLCRLSVFGRICIYRMRQSGSVLRRRALLICYDHGWWREPISHMGRLRHGFWPIFVWVNWQLWPNWLLH